MQVRIPSMRGLGDDILVTHSGDITYTLNRTTGDYSYSDGRSGNMYSDMGISGGSAGFVAANNARINQQVLTNPTWTQGSGAVHGSARTDLPNPQQCDPSDNACIASNAALEKQRLAAYTMTKVPDQTGQGTGGNNLGPPTVTAVIPATVTTSTPVVTAPPAIAQTPVVAPVYISPAIDGGPGPTTGNAGLNVPNSIWGGNYMVGRPIGAQYMTTDQSNNVDMGANGLSISTIPTWALLAAAGLAAFLMFKK